MQQQLDRIERALDKIMDKLEANAVTLARHSQLHDQYGEIIDERAAELANIKARLDSVELPAKSLKWVVGVVAAVGVFVAAVKGVFS